MKCNNNETRVLTNALYRLKLPDTTHTEGINGLCTSSHSRSPSPLSSIEIVQCWAEHNHPNKLPDFRRCRALRMSLLRSFIAYMDTGLPTVTVAYLRQKERRRAPHERNGRFSIGTSMYMRPTDMSTRQAFGYWDVDTIMSGRVKSRANMVSFAERYTRMSLQFQCAVVP